MVAPFLHYEVLGPRATLDAWLSSLQDAGNCHLADAMRGLEAEPRVGRPDLRAEEVHADLVRSEAARALRGVERVLPATPRGERTEKRPQWTLGPGGLGETEILELKDEARRIADSVREALESARLDEQEVERLDALTAACAAVEPAQGPMRVLALPRDPRRARRLRRRLRRAGVEAHVSSGERTSALVLQGDVADPAAVERVAASLGARSVEMPEDLRGLSTGELRARLAERTARARRAEGDARAALTARVREHGPRGRQLLDSLEDAERRTAARRKLASTEHVVAARVYVRAEEEPALRERLRAAHGDAVVLRPLAEAEDEPSLPRRIAPLPLTALAGLAPRGYAEVTPATLLAVLTPLAVGLAWADVAGGLLLLLAGALLGGAAGPGSPRRDTALLAQIGGLVALVVGVLTGRAFGVAGAQWFGTGWGWLPALPRLGQGLSIWVQPFAAVLGVLGLFATAAALWGGMLALHARARGRGARARSTTLTALHYAVVAGLAGVVLGPQMGLPWWWIVAPAAAIGVLLLGGPRPFLGRVALDLVGVLRLVAVAGGALLLFQIVLGSWVAPDVVDLVVGILALFVAALAVVADPAHLAMGVPYDLALGGRRVSRPFEPFRRRARRGEHD